MIKGYIGWVCCFGIGWDTSAVFEHRFSALPLCCILALSRSPHSPPSPFRAAESTLAVCEWGNICSRSLRHREGAACQEAALVQRAGASPMEPLPAGMPRRGRCWLHGSRTRSEEQSHSGWGAPESHGIAPCRGGSPQTPDTGVGVVAASPPSALCTSPAAESVTNL